VDIDEIRLEACQFLCCSDDGIRIGIIDLKSYGCSSLLMDATLRWKGWNRLAHLSIDEFGIAQGGALFAQDTRKAESLMPSMGAATRVPLTSIFPNRNEERVAFCPSLATKGVRLLQ
jgi:hypothetical protein